MDTQTWASALKQVRATLSRWPIILMPLAFLLPRFPEPWGTVLTLTFLALCVAMSTRYLIQIRRTFVKHEEAKRIESQCRLELIALTMQIDAIMTRQIKALQDGKPGAAEEARQELERIFAARVRVMEKWKSSDMPNTK